MTTPHHRREATFESSVALDHPAAAVADLVLDWGRDPLWRAHVLSFTVTPPGRAHVGQHLVEELRFAGQTFVTPTVVQSARNLSASYAGGDGAVAVRGTRAVLPRTPSGCVVHVVTRLQLTGYLRLFAPVLVPAFRRAQDADLARLAQVVDSLASSQQELSA